MTTIDESDGDSSHQEIIRMCLYTGKRTEQSLSQGCVWMCHHSCLNPIYHNIFYPWLLFKIHLHSKMLILNQTNHT